MNGLLEFAGSLFLILNIKALWRDKELKGSSWIPAVFYTFWGAFNTVFYPLNHLYFSFIGGIFVLIVNAVWLGTLWYFQQNATRN